MKKYIALVGACPPEAVSALEKRHEITKVFTLPPDPLIDSPIKNHPDTILCIYKNTLYCHEKYAGDNMALLKEIAATVNLTVSPQNVERNGEYPFDIAFNAVTFAHNDIIIGKKNSLCPPLSKYAVNTRQGYAACCSLTVGKVLVTADISVKKAADSVGIEVYTVSGEEIFLPGYERGFIGGATGATDSTVFIFGNPEMSKSGHELSEFCQSRKLELVSLCGGEVTDYGGIKFIEIE